MTVSDADVTRVAELANLELTADEKAGMLKDLNSILENVAQLNELDTTSVEPMAQVAQQVIGEEVKEGSGPPAQELRADRIVPSLNRDRVLDSAPDTDHVFFKVPKVIER